MLRHRTTTDRVQQPTSAFLFRGKRGKYVDRNQIQVIGHTQLARLPATFTWGAIFASFSKNDDGGVFKKIHQIIEHVVG